MSIIITNKGGSSSVAPRAPTTTILNTQPYVLALSSTANATVGAVYSYTAQPSGSGLIGNATVVTTISGGSSLSLSVTGPGLLASPTGSLSKVSGTGDSSIFYSSITSTGGTYTTPTSPSPLYLKVTTIGGGGGGGGGSTTAANGAGGGGGGGASISYVSSPSSTYAYSVGLGGNSGGPGTTGSNGNSGQTTTVTGITSATGGSGGTGGSGTDVPGIGGAGGTGSSSISFTGNTGGNGGPGFAGIAGGTGGVGGGSYLCGGGMGGNAVSGAGFNGNSYGGGGGGGGGLASGGGGGIGVILIEEYYQ